jgi:CTP-dependent riboflavin kinase
VATQAEAFQFRIKELEKELIESRQHLTRVCRELRDERAINRHLSRDVEKLNTIKKVLTA